MVTVLRLGIDTSTSPRGCRVVRVNTLILVLVFGGEVEKAKNLFHGHFLCSPAQSGNAVIPVPLGTDWQRPIKLGAT